MSGCNSLCVFIFVGENWISKQKPHSFPQSPLAELAGHAKFLLGTETRRAERLPPVQHDPLQARDVQAVGVLRAEQLVRTGCAGDGSHPQVTLALHAVHVLRVGVQAVRVDVACGSHKKSEPQKTSLVTTCHDPGIKHSPA